MNERIDEEFNELTEGRTEDGRHGRKDGRTDVKQMTGMDITFEQIDGNRWTYEEQNE